MPIIECIELTKAYASQAVALKNLNLSIGVGTYSKGMLQRLVEYWLKRRDLLLQ